MTRNLEKILKTDPDFFTCQNLKAVSEGFLRENVFNGLGEFCLVSERARIINEMAEIIENDYNSKFYDFVLATNFDCVAFVNLIVQKFSGFRDEAIFEGRQIFFYKRA